MSDVWRELEERLKQKAKAGIDVIDIETCNILDSEVLRNRLYEVCYHCFNKCKFFKEKQWVRLEDVKEATQQLKQNYVLVKIGDLEAIVCTSTDYDSLRDIVDDFCGNYDDVAREAYALGMKDLAKRLLRENEKAKK